MISSSNNDCNRVFPKHRRIQVGILLLAPSTFSVRRRKNSVCLFHPSGRRDLFPPLNCEKFQAPTKLERRLKWLDKTVMHPGFNSYQHMAQRALFFSLFIYLAVWGLTCSAAREILGPRPGMEPTSPALEGGFLTTGPPGKSCSLYFPASVLEHF